MIVVTPMAVLGYTSEELKTLEVGAEFKVVTPCEPWSIIEVFNNETEEAEVFFASTSELERQY